MGVRENRIETHLKKQMKSIGGQSFKWVSPGMIGVPDQICLVNGRCIFAETKCPDGYLSSQQARRITMLENLGFKVYVPKCVNDVNSMIEEIKNAK